MFEVAGLDDDGWVPPDEPPARAVFDPVTGLPFMSEENQWLVGSMTERLEWVGEQTPSALTWAALAFMRQEPMTADERMLFARAWDRQNSAVVACAAAAHVAATAVQTSDTGIPEVDGEVLDRELALMLRRSDRAMGYELGVARRLDSLLPAARALLAAGDITPAHVRVLDECTAPLTEEQTREVDAAMAERATVLTPAAFRRVVRRAVDKLLPSPEERYAKARRGAGVRLFPEADGMATLSILLPATDGVAALQSLDIAADRLRTTGDVRTHGERQVAALMDALAATRADAQGEGRVRAHRRAEVHVTIDWASLVGLRREPADLAGYGPVPAAAARALLAEPGTVLRRLVHEPVTGVLVDLGRTRYEPDDHLRRLIAARDVTCRYPGCLRAAGWCDVEHRDSYAEGGSTSCENCGLMCRTHHNLKTHHGFRYARTQPETGETVWTTPLGFTYRQRPASYDGGGADTGDTVREGPPPDG